MQEEIRKILAQYAEEQYKEFSAGLIPGAKPLMGVRLPKIRQIAKSIVADKNNKSRWRDETATFDGVYEDLFFEEIMLRGILIGYGTAKKDITCEEGLACLKDFIPYIDNWSVCDSFCNSFTFVNRYRDAVWAFLQPYLYSEQEFSIRVVLILLLSQYLKYDVDNKKVPRNKAICMADIELTQTNMEHSKQIKEQYPYLEKILLTLNRPFSQGYYAQMAAAWLTAETFVCFPYETKQMLVCNCQMDAWTYNKALQKIRESLNPDKEVKEYVKSLKRR